MSNYSYSPYVSINPQRIVFFSLPDQPRERTGGPKITGAEVRANQTMLSRKAAKRMGVAINALIYSASWKTVYVQDTGKYFRYKVNFITLTLPARQMHSDRDIVRLALSKFLEAWSKRRPGLLYCWKAEVQDNGNIHFHITSNAFYHYQKLRDDWNHYMQALGYITLQGNPSPNSTDVHSVANIKNLPAYLAGYMLKKDLYCRPLKRWHKMYKKKLLANKENLCVLPRNYFKYIKRQIDGVIWSASKPLLQTNISLHAEDPAIIQDVNRILARPDLINQYDYCSIVYLEADAFPALRHMYATWKANNPVLFNRQARSAISESILSL
jgi:hypothetical protein